MSTTQTVNHAAEKNASYRVRLNAGDKVRTNRPLRAARHDGNFKNWEHVDVPAGTILTCWGGDTNAGFRGIEFLAKFGTEGFTVTASTGAVTRIAR